MSELLTEPHLRCTSPFAPFLTPSLRERRPALLGRPAGAISVG
jgi:hypothetical protein